MTAAWTDVSSRADRRARSGRRSPDEPRWRTPVRPRPVRSPDALRDRPPQLHRRGHPDAIEAAAAVAERLDAVWTTDHVLVDRSATAADYRVNYDAIQTLAWLAARHPSLRLGTSVIVVPQRNAVVLAKELATLDALSGGRVVAGVGVGWNAREFANLGQAERFKVRGHYLSETIALWRHLWSGSSEPFEGRFHPLDNYVFGPLPPQGAALPIWVGGGPRRRFGDGPHGRRLPLVGDEP